MGFSSPEVSGFLQRLYALQSVNQLSETVCEGLGTLIGGNNVIVAKQNGVDRSLQSVVMLAPFGRMHMMPVVNEQGWMAECPLWENFLRPRKPVCTLSDFISLEQWENMPLYSEVLIEDHLRDHLTVSLDESLTSFTTLTVLRDKWGFSHDDRELLTHLRPHFQQAFRNAEAAEPLFEPKILDPRIQRTLLHVTPLGELAPDDDEGRQRVQELFHRGGAFPESVAVWLREQTDALNRGTFLSKMAPLELGTNGSRARFTLFRNMVSYAYPLMVETGSTQPHQPLAPREEEVMRWVAEGKSNAEIACILGISPLTVKTHLQRIYPKLGVENRTSAARQWREQNVQSA